METVTLRDGSRITIRPIEPDDREALAEGFRRLSPDARYRRFFGPMPELSSRDLDYLTRVDHHKHEALVAVADDGEGVGVARFVRIGEGVAEPAMTVADDWHGRGVATALLTRLVDRAREEGIHRFEAPVLATNADAAHVLARLGTTTRTYEGREVLLHIELPPEPGRGLRLPGLLRQFATGAAEPVRTVVDRLRPAVRRGEPGDTRRNVILVGTDGSEHARDAVATAAELARLSDAGVEVVAAHRFLLSDREDLERTVHEAAEELRGRGLHVHEHVVRGDPGLVLADLAADLHARLIVVGAGDRGKTARRLVGSVADLVAERAPCDVLIVRPGPG